MAHWQFRPLNPNETSGASISDDNFADEERTSVEILVRETLQNPLDARKGNSQVRVSYQLVTVLASESRFVQSMFSDDWARHFQSGGLIQDGLKPREIDFLVIEDFGTTGLEGSFTDSSSEGRTENWNAFWFREGEGAKAARANGGAGQGKITLYLASGMRSVFALTKRASDGNELLFGCCRFKRNYKVPGNPSRWAKEARWCHSSDPVELAKPIEGGTLIEDVKASLKLRRDQEPGTSFIVPMPLVDVTIESIRNAVVNEFYFAIRRGRLVVQVGDEELNKDTVEKVALDMGSACRLELSFREFLGNCAGRTEIVSTATAKASWVTQSLLSDSAFIPSELDALKKNFESSEMVIVDFPVGVRKRGESRATETWFRVFLRQEPDIDQSQELYVRQDLGIDGERRLRAARSIQQVSALTFVQDPDLSELLVAAEEPTHRQWNAKRPKVLSIYYSPEKALSAVRNAALRLAQLISPAGKRDDRALSQYFADPSSEDRLRRGAEGNEANPRSTDPEVQGPIPPAKPKPVSIKVEDDGFEVRGARIENSPAHFPLNCRVVMAYAIVSGDPYGRWDAADFWVNDRAAHPWEMEGVTDVRADGNVVSFVMESSESRFRLGGFDPKRQLEVRVSYKEAADGSDIENN